MDSKKPKYEITAVKIDLRPLLDLTSRIKNSLSVIKEGIKDTKENNSLKNKSKDKLNTSFRGTSSD